LSTEKKIPQADNFEKMSNIPARPHKMPHKKPHKI